jgi:multidrug efflux pump subunit AcrA (membrane-fusion protein)
MKNIFRITILVTILQSCHTRQAIIHPQIENIAESVYASGIVKSIDQYEVFAPVNGLIQKIFVAKGDTVRKGDVIAQVVSETARLNTDNSKLAADNASIAANTDKINALQASIVFLKAKAQNDSVLLVRQRNLWAAEIGTRNELEQRELAYKNDIASYNTAVYNYQDFQRQLHFSAAQLKNNLQISKTIAGDFAVKSKMNGRVYSIIKEPGEMVTAQTPIAVIGSAADFKLELQVDEYDIGKIREGQKILLTMDSYKGKVYEGRVVRIIPFMNDRTRSFTIEAFFLNRPPALYPNLTAEANIMIRTKENAITIPRDCLVDDSVVLLTGGKRKTIVTGLIDYHKVEVVSGLTVQDEIVKPLQ